MTQEDSRHPLLSNTMKIKTKHSISWQRKCLIPLIIGVLLLFMLVFWETNKLIRKPRKSIKGDKTWEFLLFTQQWPISFCESWSEEKQISPSECNFPSNPQTWTVHGIWPTENSTSYPQYCRHIPFNESAIVPIEDQLNEHWTAIQKQNDTAFWKHEWRKHGTCSIQIPQLDTEFKYFSQGLQWNEKYNFTDSLIQCQIEPSDTKLYKTSELIDCIKKEFGIVPLLYCVRDKVRQQQVITEIRLCVDKDLNFVSCDNFKMDQKCGTNFIYPAAVRSL